MKTSSNSTSVVLAQAASRRRWRVEDAERVLSAWRDSGVSVSSFARRHGIHVARLLRWRQHLAQGDRLKFHPVQLVSGSDREGVEGGIVTLVLRNGRRVEVGRGFDAGLLEEVVRAVESWSC